jgi:hypothetical protein
LNQCVDPCKIGYIGNTDGFWSVQVPSRSAVVIDLRLF